MNNFTIVINWIYESRCSHKMHQVNILNQSRSLSSCACDVLFTHICNSTVLLFVQINLHVFLIVFISTKILHKYRLRLDCYNAKYFSTHKWGINMVMFKMSSNHSSPKIFRVRVRVFFLCVQPKICKPIEMWPTWVFHCEVHSHSYVN